MTPEPGPVGPSGRIPAAARRPRAGRISRRSQGRPGQGGYPPQPGQGGYPPPPGQGGYPPPGQGGYNRHPDTPSRPPAHTTRRARTRRRVASRATRRRAVAYGPQGPPGGGFSPQSGPPAKKSRGLIIGIVIAAVVLLVAVGGIIMVLNRGGGDDPGPVSITPSQPVPPTEQPTEQPTDQPTDESDDRGADARPDRDLGAAERQRDRSRERDHADPGRRLGGQEDRQGRRTAVRRQEHLPRPGHQGRTEHQRRPVVHRPGTRASPKAPRAASSRSRRTSTSAPRS